MQLPPALRARLVGGPGAAEPLPVVRDPAAGRAPFRFVARKVRFPREHEFFEDGDVQRHLYLQDVLTQVAEEPQRSSTSAWWKAARRSSRPVLPGRTTWCGSICTLQTSGLTNPGKAEDWPHRGHVCPCRPKPLAVAASSQKGTPWKCVLLRTWPSPGGPPVRAGPWRHAWRSGLTAAGFLLPYVSVKAQPEGLKAPRRETSASDGLREANVPLRPLSSLRAGTRLPFAR
ncbi:zinc finger protein 511 isoform X5 [Choloepus didactylus]|uniref:zinc finger protein 511 isoform X5 n=1 Tax=Choloepus didactylus TaxID=27675 RepID=UPI0018A0B9DE|nr:zinc finger protein 511 isoform X5 [Choloepus didactylus]